MSETPAQTNGGQEQKKWQTTSAFMMNLNSKQFLVTLALIIYAGVIIYLALHLPTAISTDFYLAVVGVANSFLLPIVVFWFKQDQDRRMSEANSGGK